METTTNTKDHNGTSIKKLYLEKRAKILRDSFDKNKANYKNLAGEIESTQFNATKDELLFAKCLSWMHENTHQDANIADLAQLLSISVRKIQRLFSFFLDKTYTTVLLDMRIEAAKGYLGQQKYSVGEVAYLVGVKDHAYFTYLFRKNTGMTPTEYRLSLIQSQISG